MLSCLRSFCILLCKLLGILWLGVAIAIGALGLAMPREKADLTVVFGNALEADGTPRPILADRLDAAVRCHREGVCSTLFVSGSVDGPGLDEAASMRRYLMEQGVPDSAIVVDDQGNNTLATARHALAYMREHDMRSVLLVSQYYHLPRARMAFERVGAEAVFGLYPRRFRWRDLYSNWREVPAFLVYRVRLALNPDAPPVSFRPVWFLIDLLSRFRG